MRTKNDFHRSRKIIPNDHGCFPRKTPHGSNTYIYIHYISASGHDFFLFEIFPKIWHHNCVADIADISLKCWGALLVPFRVIAEVVNSNRLNQSSKVSHCPMVFKSQKQNLLLAKQTEGKLIRAASKHWQKRRNDFIKIRGGTITSLKEVKESSPAVQKWRRNILLPAKSRNFGLVELANVAKRFFSSPVWVIPNKSLWLVERPEAFSLKRLTKNHLSFQFPAWAWNKKITSEKA